MYLNFFFNCLTCYYIEILEHFSLDVFFLMKHQIEFSANFTSHLDVKQLILRNSFIEQ